MEGAGGTFVEVGCTEHPATLKISKIEILFHMTAFLSNGAKP
jgi:hypothetical protein